MNTATFLKECSHRGISISLDGGALSVKPETVPAKTVNYIRSHKSEIIHELSTHHDASKLAVLLSLPDGFQFWLAPDGMEFDAGDIPILRRSVMDELAASGADVKTELHSIIQSMRELGGDLCVTDNSEGNRPLPDTQKAVTGEMVRPSHG